MIINLNYLSFCDSFTRMLMFVAKIRETAKKYFNKMQDCINIRKYKSFKYEQLNQMKNSNLRNINTKKSTKVCEEFKKFGKNKSRDT